VSTSSAGAHQDKDAIAGSQAVVIEMMTMDSDKHARLLQFVHDRLASRAGSKASLSG
jgi:hypothetical protein